MPTKILFVINPISGGVNKDEFIERIKASCNHQNLNYKIVETTGRNDEQLIRENIAEFAPEVGVACGGDGTINLLGRVLLHNGVKMGIIPLGSANGLATELSITRNINRSIQIIVEGKTISMDVLLVNEQHYSFHLSDSGFNAKLIKQFEETRIRGKFGYMLNFVKTLAKSRPLKYRVELPDKKFKQKAEMIVFANARMYGTGAMVNPQGKIDDGKFEVCIIKPYPWYAIFSIAWQSFTGSISQSPYVIIHRTDYVKINTKKAETLQVDGEIIGEFKEVTVRTYDEKIEVVVPEQYMP